MNDERDAGLEKDEVGFLYKKSQFFRVIFVTGVTGGINPRGLVQMSVFNERGAIPEREVFKLTSEGRVGSPVPEKREAKGDFIREVEATMLFDFEAAKALHGWLDKVIKAGEVLDHGR